MSDKNINIDEFDLMMKSVLGEAQEEVPERVWEGISAGLDEAAGRKTVVLWWRRAVTGVAAAAAVMLGAFLMDRPEDQMVPAAGEGMIAVVEPEAEEVQPAGNEIQDQPETYTLVAEAAEYAGSMMIPDDETVPGTAADAIESERRERIEEEDIREAVDNEKDMVDERKTGPSEEIEPSGKVGDKAEAAGYFPEDWGEEETISKKRNVSLVLSGVTGTNNATNGNRRSPSYMSPTVNPAPKKTGIEETSVKSSFGIPLSFGAGVKFDLNRRWSLGTGINYTFLSRQFYGKYTKVGDDGGIERVISADIRNQQHYVGIPVNVFYDVISNDRISFYAYAGGTVEKCLSDSYHLLNTSINHKENAKGVQLSANAGIGVEFMLGEHLGLYIDPSLRYYFDNGQPKSVRTVQPLMLGFEMGIRAML